MSSNTETHYRYDALGRRTSKATYGRHTGHTARSRTDFVWEGFRLLQENMQQQGWRTYLYDTEQPYTPVACVTGRGEGRQVWYYHTDVTGTPQEVTAADGTLVWAGYIRGFGENAADISNSGAYFHQPLRLPGQYFDDETGLHYNLFRYYAPECGRFISQDPIGLAGGLNLYAYAPNPLSWIDPLGLTTEYKSESPYHGRKPTYVNPGHHDPSSPDFRGGGSKTTHLPPDAEEVYRRAVPSDSSGNTWFGRNSEGEFYRYQGSNGEVHWNGREKSDRGLKIPKWIRDRFNQMAAKIKGLGGKCG
ncbi:hypothetical protein DU258_25025 [Salmonella enterica subsp. enterica]|nr:hypothetical protein [Salmonella enterica subsp. enterica]MKD05653.1 hypothetical protein [Salmonella enterica subsp. enterica serovar Kambole]